MKFLFDFFPILLFFIAYKFFDIYVATGVAIAATVVQIAIFWLRHRRFETMQLVTLGLIVVFGGTTIYLHDPQFIKWKVSIFYWLLGGALLISQFIGSRTGIERMMGNVIKLKVNIWPRLNLAWATFFLTVGFVNLYVMYNFDTDTWVDFKLFGTLGLTIVFGIAQSFYMAKFIDEEAMEKEKE